MRRLVFALVTSVLLAVPGVASAQSGGSAAPDESGGASFGSPPRGPGLVVRRFAVTPGAAAPGRTLTVAFRIDGRVAAARVRIDLVAGEGSSPAATLRLGRRATNRRQHVRWTPRLEPGAYTARLHATAVRSRRRAQVSTSSTLRVDAPKVTAPPVGPLLTRSGVFPVQGAYNLGGADGRFGAKRAGHIHQGQDVLAAEGTPVVSPRAGTVIWRAYQAAGAGYYVVVHGDDGRDYVFMHLQAGSILVSKGAAVAAGQRIAAVGTTGSSEGPHLHFEIWPNGWYAKGSQPIDPLPDLLAWAG